MSDEIRNDSFNNESNEFEKTNTSKTTEKVEAPASEKTAEKELPREDNPTYVNRDTGVYNRPESHNPYTQPNYNPGYYSSAPDNRGTYPYPNQPYGYSNVNEYATVGQLKQKKEKKKSNAGLVVCCVVLSLLCGIAGAFGGLYVYNEFFAKEVSSPADNGGNGSTVIYESVDKTLTDDIKEAGSVAAVAKIALPSVVEITTEAVVNNSFYGQYVTEGAGSGVIISPDGYIVTNNHVVSGASNITVRLTNGDEHKATLIGTDAQTDIAVIKIEAENLVSAIFGDSSKLVIGELTVAIGNPLGELGGTVTDGIISALDREITVEGENMVLLQTNAAVSPGNSGGGLFNANGELIGIVNAKSSGSSIEGLGFAIPVNTAKPIIADLIEKGHVTGRPSIGITIVEVTSDYQRFMYGVSDYGVYIQKALNEEFKAGDRIIAIDGNSISTSSDIKSIISNHSVGDKVTVTVSRKNKIVDVEVTLIDSVDNSLTTQNK